jgi:hypothetical protein
VGTAVKGQLPAFAWTLLINWTLIEVVRGRDLTTIVMPSQLAHVVTFMTFPNLGYKIGRS